MEYLLLAGPIIFLVVTLILSFLTPNYSYRENYISELSCRKHGKIQKANFFISGLLFSALCLLLVLRSTDQIIKIGWCFGIVVGMSIITTGIWDTDFGKSKRTLAGKIHEFIYTSIGVPSTGAIYFVLGWGYRRIPLVLIISWAVAIFSFVIYKFGNRFHIKIGIAQRIVVFLAVIWIEALAILTLSGRL